MKFVRGFKLIGILSLVPMLAGCGLNTSSQEEVPNSPAWDAGYETQLSLDATPISDYAEAVAYCSAIQESQFPTDVETEVNDYVEGCVTFVYSGHDSESEPELETETEVEEPVITESDILVRLNNAGNTSWAEDKFQDLSGSPAEAIYLGTSPDDGSICAVWVFDSKETAVSEAESGSFNWVTGNYWWGDERSGKGIVLIAESTDTACLIDSTYGLEWDLR
jgi:hypothetical protein